MSNQSIKELWEKSGSADLLKGKTFQEIFDNAPDKALELSDTYLRCIDEGTPGGMHLAGSGVLYDNAAKDLKGKISGVYSHEGCGAVKLYAEQQNITNKDIETLAQDRARQIANKVGVPYLGHISFGEMRRPAQLHTARVIYYDGTGKLDPTHIAALPLGFVISRALISDLLYAKTELEVAVSIATGEHGFGRLFAKESPLYIVVVSSAFNIESLINETVEITQKFDNVKVERIVI